MAAAMNIKKQLEVQRSLTLKHILIGWCTIARRVASGVSDVGVASTSSSQVLYRGNPDIPCLLVGSAAFRPANLNAQITEAAEYHIDLPYDIAIRPSDVIFVEGEEYVIRKLVDRQTMDVVTTATVERLGVNRNGQV